MSLKTLCTAGALALSVLISPPASAQRIADMPQNPQTISAQTARQMMTEAKDYVILDVRTPEEYDRGHIPGAKNLPLDAIEAGKIPAEFAAKDKKYFVYCRSGVRSAKTADALASYGYKDILDFGGIIDWPYEVTR